MKIKRALLLAAVLFAMTLPLFAVSVTVEWNWVQNDSDVRYFRYQVDGEAEDGWTVVDSSVTNYTAKGLDGSQSYTLYLQQSYDGVYWSQSASSVSQPVVPQTAEVEEPVVTEEPAVVEAAAVEEEPAVVVEEAVVEEEPAVQESSAAEAEEIAPVAVTPSQPVGEPGSFKFVLSFAGGVGLNNIGEELDYDYQAVIGLGFEDMVANSIMGWDLKLNLGFIANSEYDIADTTFENLFDLGQYHKAMFADLMTGVNFKAGSTQFYLDGGARLLMSYDGFENPDALFTMGKFNARVQITGLLGFRWNIGWFNLGLEGQYVYDYIDNVHTVTPRLLFGFSF